VAPHAIETLKHLKEVTGLKLAAYSHSALPQRKAIPFHGLFDAFIASGDVGDCKASGDFVRHVL